MQQTPDYITSRPGSWVAIRSEPVNLDVTFDPKAPNFSWGNRWRAIGGVSRAAEPEADVELDLGGSGRGFPGGFWTNGSPSRVPRDLLTSPYIFPRDL